LKDGAWDEFDSEASVHGILGGVISVEELRIPARNFSGMGLTMLDVERQLWADCWVNGKSGVLTPPPAWGSFVEGRGTSDSDEPEPTSPSSCAASGTRSRPPPAAGSRRCRVTTARAGKRTG